MSPRLAWLRRNGPAVFGVLRLIGAIYVVQREFRTLSVADIRQAMAAIPPITLWKAAGWTVLAYLVLAVYDKLGSRYAGRPVSWPSRVIHSSSLSSMSKSLFMPKAP